MTVIDLFARRPPTAATPAPPLPPVPGNISPERLRELARYLLDAPSGDKAADGAASILLTHFRGNMVALRSLLADVRAEVQS